VERSAGFGAKPGAGYKQALTDLCRLYWYPLYAFIRNRGYSPEDAQDLVQGFFLHLIEYRTLSPVDRSKGKFRSFLLASLKNYLANETDRACCLKRGGAFVRIDLEKAEHRYGLEPVEELTPEKVFDARWAVALLGEAMRSSFLAGPFTDKAPAEILHRQTNLLTLLSLGSGIQIHGSERLGRRVSELRNSSLIVEHYYSWMVWSRSKIHLVHRKDGYVSLPFRRFCANSLPLILGFA
jgi:DNA-directed RNA polymerase specialized sigma24 family protein